MGGRRATVATARVPRLSLRVRSIEFDDPPGEWFQRPAKLAPLIDALARSGLAPPTIAIREIGRRGRTVGRWDVAKDRVREAEQPLFEISPADPAARSFELNLNRTDVSIVVDWTFRVDDATFPGTRSLFRELLKRIHDEYCHRATVGPILAIVPRWLPYPRPTPPRVHPHWPAGAVTLAACRRGYERSKSDGAAQFEALSSAALPPGITRRVSGDLLLLDVDAAAGDALGMQRAALERWIGDTMQLDVDDDYRDNGDRRLFVWQRDPVPPLGFYDPAGRALYRAVTELAHDDLDPDTMERMADALACRELADGRPVAARVIVFVGRSAALRWADWVAERGGKTAYLGDDSQLWAPHPEAS